MQGAENISLIMAFTAGVLAFLSPCVLPLIPAYLSYLTGMSFHEISGKTTPAGRRKIRLTTVFHALGFILGFSIIFVLLGASVTLAGKLLFQYQAVLKKIGALAIMFFGLVVMDVIKIPILSGEKKFSYKKNSISFLSSIAVGAIFAAAWTPCIGPILGSILIYASSAESARSGIKLLGAFSLGMGLPFFLAALLVNTFLAHIKKIERYLRWIKVTAGVILIIFGILLLTGRGIS